MKVEINQQQIAIDATVAALQRQRDEFANQVVNERAQGAILRAAHEAANKRNAEIEKKVAALEKKVAELEVPAKDQAKPANGARAENDVQA